MLSQVFTKFFHTIFTSIEIKIKIVDIEKPDGISLLTFVVDEFLGLVFYPSVFSITHSR